jgi:hypothetical protein
MKALPNFSFSGKVNLFDQKGLINKVKRFGYNNKIDFEEKRLRMLKYHHK